jgi:hypothetical protein
MTTMTSVWYDDVTVLWRNWTAIIPKLNDTPEERTNALVRLIVALSIGAALYTRKAAYLLYGTMSIAATTFVHTRSALGKGGAALQGGTLTARNREALKNGRPLPPPPEHAAALAEVEKKRGEPISAPGCVRSTAENPFGNMLLTDISDRPDRPPACAYDDMKDDIEKNFEVGLFQNSTDLFKKENSQRQYYTMPVSTTLPDTYAFAQFLYGNAKNCKTVPSQCTGHD